MSEVLEQLRDMDARRKAEGIDPKKNPAQLPKSDLDARILPNKEGGYAPNFTPLVVNEMANGFIVESEVLEWQWCCTAFNLKKLMTLMAALRAEQYKTAKIER